MLMRGGERNSPTHTHTHRQNEADGALDQRVMTHIRDVKMTPKKCVYTYKTYALDNIQETFRYIVYVRQKSKKKKKSEVIKQYKNV